MVRLPRLGSAEAVLTAATIASTNLKDIKAFYVKMLCFDLPARRYPRSRAAVHWFIVACGMDRCSDDDENITIPRMSEDFWSGGVTKDAVSPLNMPLTLLHEYGDGLAFVLTFANVVVVSTKEGDSCSQQPVQ